MNPPKTTLTAFFELCSSDDFAKTLLYSEVYKYYTYSKSGFARRKRGDPNPDWPGIFASETIGRLYTVHPSQAECFYLRLLLTKIRGPTSFSNLREFQGAVLPTYL